MQKLINHIILQLQNPSMGMGALVAESLIYLHDYLNRRSNQFLTPQERALKTVLNITVSSAGLTYAIDEDGNIVTEEYGDDYTEDLEPEFGPGDGIIYSIVKDRT